MHSLLKTAAFATVILYAAAGGAFAASDHDHGHDHDHDHDHDRHVAVIHSNEPSGQSQYVQLNPVFPVAAEGPRLTRVMNELRAEHYRMDLDSAHGKLTPANVDLLEREEAAIRDQAIDTANVNGGTIPDRSYAQIQGEVRHFGRDITRMS